MPLLRRLARRFSLGAATRPHVPHYKDVHALADAHTDSISSAIVRAVQDAVRAAPDSTFHRLLLPGASPTLAQLMPMLDTIERALKPKLVPIVTALYLGGGKVALDGLAAKRASELRLFKDPPPGIGVSQSMLPVTSFDTITPGALDWVQNFAGDMISSITADQLESIKAILGSSVAGFWDVNTTAQILPSVIGLTPRSAAAVGRMLSGLLEDAETEAERQQAAGAASAYGSRLLTQRAETIARTETLHAANKGVSDGFKDAAVSGLLDTDMIRIWIVTEDDLLCPDCEALDGEEAPVDGDFPGDGGDGPPLHPDCRCAQGLISSDGSVVEE